MNYFMSLDPLALFRSMPGAFAQGMVWGLMALGVYITYRLLDFADLTVDGSLATGHSGKHFNPDFPVFHQPEHHGLFQPGRQC